MKPYTLDNNLEPQTRPLHDFQEGYNPFNTRKLHPTSPRSCLAECEPFCLQPRKKSIQRTSLGTNKGTSLGSYPKKLKKKKKEKADTLEQSKNTELLSYTSAVLYQLSHTLTAVSETRDKLDHEKHNIQVNKYHLSTSSSNIRYLYL